MKASVVYGKGDLRLEDIKMPDVPNRSIRVRVMACAICGTDIRIYQKGDHRAAYPVVVGHEIAAVVDAVSSGVDGFKEGMKVCVAPGHGCGCCRMCKMGYPNVCTTPYPSLGYKVNGGFEEYMAIPENILRLGFVNPIPESLSFEEATLSEIIACCLNAQKNTSVGRDDTVLVMGAGPAGVVHTQLARMQGAKKVLLTQRSRKRLELVQKRFSVDRIIASSEEDLTEAVMEETGGKGADVIFVCAPSAEAQEQAFHLLAPRGRVNFFGGLPPDDHVIHIDANIVHYKEIFIAGASSSTPEGNRLALKLLAGKKIDANLLITHRFGIDDIQQAFDTASQKRGIKVVVHL